MRMRIRWLNGRIWICVLAWSQYEIRRYEVPIYILQSLKSISQSLSLTCRPRCLMSSMTRLLPWCGKLCVSSLPCSQPQVTNTSSPYRPSIAESLFIDLLVTINVIASPKISMMLQRLEKMRECMKIAPMFLDKNEKLSSYVLKPSSE
jgi:hypothetical protein